MSQKEKKKRKEKRQEFENLGHISPPARQGRPTTRPILPLPVIELRIPRDPPFYRFDFCGGDFGVLLVCN